MNKLSKEQIELATEEIISIANFDDARSLTMEEIDQLVRDQVINLPRGLKIDHPRFIVFSKSTPRDLMVL